MDDIPPPSRDPVDVFRGWHRDPSLWREIYVRTVSALVAASVIYFVAVVSGLASRRPLVVVAAVFFGIGGPYFILGLVGSIRDWSRVRALFGTAAWTGEPDVPGANARRVYTRLTMGGMLVAYGLIMLVAGFTAQQ